MIELLQLPLSRQRDGGGDYRYIRLERLVPSYVPSWVSIYEIQIIGNAVNWSRESVAIASAINSYAGQPPSGMIDGYIDVNVESHRWATEVPYDANSIAWVQVDLGLVRTIETIVMASDGTHGQGPKSFDILGSVDGINWDLLKECRNITWVTGILQQVL